MKVIVAKISLISLFLIIAVLHLFSFLGQFSHVISGRGISLLLEIALLTLLGSLFLSAQISIFALWKIIYHILSNSFYPAKFLLWMNRLVGILKVTPAFPVLLILIIAPQADDPGVLGMLTPITLFIFTVYAINALLRDQIQNSPNYIWVG